MSAAHTATHNPIEDVDDLERQCTKVGAEAGCGGPAILALNGLPLFLPFNGIGNWRNPVFPAEATQKSSQAEAIAKFR